jgi:hypothetical protein
MWETKAWTATSEEALAGASPAEPILAQGSRSISMDKPLGCALTILLVKVGEQELALLEKLPPPLLPHYYSSQNGPRSRSW